jgi:hypothetical protein
MASSGSASLGKFLEKATFKSDHILSNSGMKERKMTF